MRNHPAIPLPAYCERTEAAWLASAAIDLLMRHGSERLMRGDFTAEEEAMLSDDPADVRYAVAHATPEMGDAFALHMATDEYGNIASPSVADFSVARCQDTLIEAAWFGWLNR